MLNKLIFVSPTEEFEKILGELRLSEETKKYYRKLFRLFIKWLGNREITEDSLFEYLSFLKGRVEKGELNSSSLPNYFKPIQLYCSEKNILLNWKKLSRRFPEAVINKNGYPSDEQIQAFFSLCDDFTKLFASVLIYSGLRVGGLLGLRVKDLKAFGDFVILTVYQGTQEEYTTFIPRSIGLLIEKHLEEREKKGEAITSDTLVFNEPYPIILKHLKSTWVKVCKWRKNVNFSPIHIFRKIFRTELQKSGIETLYCEILLGHDTGLNKVYFRPSVNDLLEKYVKVLPHLNALTKSTLKPEEN
jgi:integrase